MILGWDWGASPTIQFPPPPLNHLLIACPVAVKIANRTCILSSSSLTDSIHDCKLLIHWNSVRHFFNIRWCFHMIDFYRNDINKACIKRSDTETPYLWTAIPLRWFLLVNLPFLSTLFPISLPCDSSLWSPIPGSSSKKAVPCFPGIKPLLF